MRTLAERLESMKAASAKRIPAAAKAVMHRATEDLRASGILERLPRAGQALPPFELRGSEGQLVRSADLLGSSGPGHLVLSFYRGKW